MHEGVDVAVAVGLGLDDAVLLGGGGGGGGMKRGHMGRMKRGHMWA
jgi:hypothetical protein